MKRSKAQKPADAPVETCAAGTSSSHRPLTLSNKKRRNNPDECCSTCKLRKVKCSGKSGSNPCENCSRLKLTCNFTLPGHCFHPHENKVARITPTSTVTEAGTIRKRAQRACSQCHTSKSKCSGDLPICRRCQLNGLACEYVPTKRKFANLAAPSSSAEGTPTPPSAAAIASSDACLYEAGSETNNEASALSIAFGPSPAFQDQLTKRDIILKHVNCYFDHYFHMPCMGFLHPLSVYRLIDEDKLSPHLAAGICSITATFVSTVASGGALAARCNEQVELHVLRNFAFMERDLLVFHVFAAVYNWMSGPLSKVWMWTSTASRLIKCLQLNYEPDTRSAQESFTRREIQRRSVWQIYLIDHFLSGGFEEHLLLPSSSMHLRLPCTDNVFRDELPSAMETLDKDLSIPSNVGDYSLDACHVRLLTIRSQVLSVTKKFADSSQSSLADPRRPEQFMEHVNRFQIALNRFSDSLPEHLKLSKANIDAHLHRPDRASFTMLHTWFCQTHIELYRFSVERLNEAAPNESSGSSIPWGFLLRSHEEFLLRSRQQAVSYAICLAQTWEYCAENIKKNTSTGISRSLVTVDWMIGACAVDVTHVLLVARKHKLYENIRGNSSAQMCAMVPINDELLASLISNILRLLDNLIIILPRIEHYQQDVINKIKKFDDEMANSQSQIAVNFSHHEATPSPKLPGPDNMLPNIQLEQEDPTKYVPDSTSMSDRFLRKKMAVSEKLQSHHNGVTVGSVIDPPVIPYCLRHARGSSPAGPFAGPPLRNHKPSQSPTSDPVLVTSANTVLDLRLLPDTSIRTSMTPERAMSIPMVFGTFGETAEELPQAQIQTPIVPSQTNHIVFDPYAVTYPYSQEQPKGQWVHPEQRNGYT